MAYSQEHRPATTERPLSRRSFLVLGALAAAAGLAPLPVLARTRRAAGAPQSRREPPQARAHQSQARPQTVARSRRGRRTETVARGRRGGPAARGRQGQAVAQVRHEEVSVRLRRAERSAPAERPTFTRYEEPATYLHAAARPEKSLAIYNPHTGEGLKQIYWFRGKYLPGALRDFDYLLRDYRANEVKPIDPELLDLLYAMSTLLETEEPFYVMSGYRSPSTNAMLRMLRGGVAENSMHIEGKAVDIRLPGRDASYVRRAAVALQAGGVGYYRWSNFVHVDTGPVRYW